AQAVGAELLPAEQLREQLLLLGGAVRGQTEARQRMDTHAHRNRRPYAGDLLQNLQVDLVRLPAAAEAFGVGEPEQSGGAERPEDVSREPLFGLELVDLPSELFRREGPGQVDELHGLRCGEHT